MLYCAREPRVQSGFLKLMEEHTTRRAAGLHAASNDKSPHSFLVRTVNRHLLQTRRVAPDVPERDTSELAAKLRSYADTAEQSRCPVAAVLPARETCVGQPPHAVDAVGAIWLSNNIFKLTL